MIRINPLFFIVLGIVCLLNLFPEFLTVFGVAILHEIAHAICAYFCGNRDIVFHIQPWGVCMKCRGFNSLKHEFYVASAGPFLNLILIILCSFFKLQGLYITNLFMLIINLLPVYPLDGGRILNAILKSEFPHNVAEKILKVVSSALVIAMFLSGCFLLYRTGVNFSVLIASLFLCLCSDRTDENEKHEPIKKAVHYSVEFDEKVKCALKHSDRKNMIVFDVIDTSYRYMGSVTYREVLEEIANNNYEIKFGEILEKRLLY